MREIKFRAWDKQAKNMVYSYGTYPRSIYKFEFDIVSSFEFKLTKMTDRLNVYDKDGDDYYLEYFEPIEADIMQYTGIKDISGNEIYEGDIVTSETTGPGLGSFFKGIVKFYDGTYWIENKETELVTPLFEEANELKVIGNVFEK